MRYVIVFFTPEPHLPDDIMFAVRSNYVETTESGRTRLHAVGGGSMLDMKLAHAVRYGFAASRGDAQTGRFYIEKELRTDEDFVEFYRTYTRERHNETIEDSLETLG